MNCDASLFDWLPLSEPFCWIHPGSRCLAELQKCSEHVCRAKGLGMGRLSLGEGVFRFSSITWLATRIAMLKKHSPLSSKSFLYKLVSNIWEWWNISVKGWSLVMMPLHPPVYNTLPQLFYTFVKALMLTLCFYTSLLFQLCSPVCMLKHFKPQRSWKNGIVRTIYPSWESSFAGILPYLLYPYAISSTVMWNIHS